MIMIRTRDLYAVVKEAPRRITEKYKRRGDTGPGTHDRLRKISTLKQGQRPDGNFVGFIEELSI